MKIYPHMPHELVKDWPKQTMSDPCGTQAVFHYHAVEEWLEVVKGDITFFPLSDQPYRVVVGQVLRIPRGEVHRVEVGQNEVEYQMWVPIPPTEDFPNELTPQEVALLKKNLEFPKREDNRNNDAAPFFQDILSDALSFCRADGTVVSKQEFIAAGFTDRGRRSSGSVQVLNRTANGSLLLTTVVTVTNTAPSQSFTNVRLFVPENGSPKCRLWVNYPEPVLPDGMAVCGDRRGTQRR